MGTDIHLSAEVQTEDGWEHIPGPVIDCWSCDGTAVALKWEGRERVPDPSGEPCRWCTREPVLDPDDIWDYEYAAARYVGPGKTRDAWYSDRNYDVFAALAGVRNGTGFAGVYRHDPIVPIAEPRGVPEDATEKSLTALSNEHTPTWLMLDEVMRYDWDQPLHRGGVVSLEEFDVYLRTGKPNGWCGGISGPNIVLVSVEVATQMVKNKQMDPNTYVHLRWSDSLKPSAEAFLDRMKMLAAEAGERPVRLVFDFDS